MGDVLTPIARRGKTILRAVTVAAFLLTVSIATLQIISRYLPRDFPISFLWTGELATNLLVFVIFFGAVLAEIDGGQLRIDILRDQIESVIGPVYELFILASSLVFTVLVVYGAYVQTQASWGNTGLLLTWFRTGYLYAFILVAFAILTALRLWRAGEIVRAWIGRDSYDAEETDEAERRL